MQSKRKTRFLILIVTVALAAVILLSTNSPISGILGNEDGHSKKTAGDRNPEDDSSGITKKARLLSERAAAMKAADESIRLQKLQSKEDGTNVPVSYNLFGKDGSLTDEAAAAAELTEEEKKTVSAIMHAAWESTALNFINNAVIDEEKSDLAKEQYVYNIKAPDPSASTLQAFRTSLDAAIGEKKRKTLMRGTGSSACFGKFGSLDITIELSPREGTFSYQYNDPGTGKPHKIGKGAISEFSDKFGDTFDFSAMKFATYQDPTKHD